MPRRPAAAPAVPARADAARNRARLLDAADELLALRGLDFTLNQLAQHAGVGVATVYRHFADRDALIDALVVSRIDVAERLMREGIAADDPVAGLRQTLVAVSERQTEDRGLWQVLSSGTHLRMLIRERLEPLAGELVRRAVATGRMRADVSATDVPMLLWLSGAVYDYTGDVAPDLWRRYLDLMLDGLLVTAAAGPLPPAPDTDRMDEFGASAAARAVRTRT